ncbi:MAG: DUF5682 family protein [Acidimicrobiia bacterium]
MSVHLFGIRHHGPGSARSVERALEALRPDIVLIELPKEADPLLALVATEGMRPPVALLGYVVDRPERAVFLPFASFSPEWRVVQLAAARSVPILCIDLPLAVSLAIEPGARAGGQVDPLALLASAAGYDDAERWWDDVVEHRGDGVPPFDAIAEAMAAMRDDEPPPASVEARREATMRQAIRAAQRDGFERIAVVCGAWHVPALARTDEITATADASVLRGQPSAKVGLTWVPWTHRRLGAASGYGAGVASPGWYAHVFRHRPERVVSAWFGRIAQLLREHDLGVSPDDLIAATRLAEGLAVLRNRPRPGLDELTDAAFATLAGGRPGPLALIDEHLVVGDEIGAVPPETPMVPLARDLRARQRATRMKPSGLEKVLELDLRQPLGLARSHLLHRLWALGVHWGTPEQSRSSTGTFRETWRLRWEPELDVCLIEASAYGTTVEAAAAARFAERAEAPGLGVADITALLEAALLADLPSAVSVLTTRLAGRIAAASGVEQLIDALGPLARALRYGDVRSTDAGALAAVVDGFVRRICVGLPTSLASLDDDAAHAAADRMLAVQGALALLDHPAREHEWPAVLQRIADQPGANGVVSGRALRLLLNAERIDGAEAERRLARALSGGVAASDGAAFVEGVLAGSGTVLLHDDRLLRVLDQWVATLPERSFTDVVPLLRRTFGAFEVAERRQLGQLVAGQGEHRPAAPFGWDLDPARVAAAVATLHELLGTSS